MLKEFIEFIMRKFYMHEWEIIKEVNVWNDSCDKYPISRDFICKCKVCGKIKRFKG